MSVQIDCPECSGPMTVETPGVTVACPHCGAHVPTSGRTPVGNETEIDENAFSARETVLTESESVFEVVVSNSTSDSFTNLAAIQAAALEAFDEEPLVDAHRSGGDRQPPRTTDSAEREEDGIPDLPDFGAEPASDEWASAEEVTINTSGPQRLDDDDTRELSPEELGELRGEEATIVEAPQIETPAAKAASPDPRVGADPDVETIEFTPSAEETARGVAESTVPSPRPHFDAASARPPVTTGSAQSAARGPSFPRPVGDRVATVPRSWFVLAVSYGSLTTLLLIGLVWDVMRGGLVYRKLAPMHQLESLPDIVKLEDLRIVPPDAELPRGHVLAIGDEQRFGNLRVKVLRVTREPVMQEERDLLGAVTQTYPSDAPVLHLWLEFQNVSRGQRFAPLDRVLLLASGRTKTSGDEERSNQFVCRLDERHVGGQLVPPYWIGGSYYARQPFGEPLGPGETATLYVPSSEEGVEELEGELVWRVQFRKGFGERSNKGLTTLVDVRFHSNEIEDRITAAAPDA